MLRAVSLMGVFAQYDKSMLVLKLAGAWGGLPSTCADRLPARAVTEQ
jgi:hypothetical protein